jgi:hypothetical protein
MTDYDRYNTLCTTVSYTDILQRYLEKWFGKHIDGMHIQYDDERDKIQIEFTLKE